MNYKKTTIFAAAAVSFSLLCSCGGDSTYKSAQKETANLRDYYTTIKGNSEDTVTLMVYMIGSDLETDGAAASSDINEMLNANTDNINIVIQTGGTSDWENPNIGDGVTERHIIKDGTIIKTADLGMASMVDSAMLADFIKTSAEQYPANRYELVLWNHGGGTIMGYGYDEMNPEEMLELSEIGEALKSSGIKFDMVGFDACLMCTIETAYMLEPYADYMIASEEYEPGTGWYYTEWLENLSSDTSASTIDIGEKIIDDYITGPDASFYDSNTLSLVDLREIPNVYENLYNFLDETKTELDFEYNNISGARFDSKAFGDGEYEQIDIISYLNTLGSDKGNNLVQAVNSAVKYNGSSDYDANGLAMYFPYEYPEYYSDVLTDVKKFGYGEECEPFFSKFVNILTGGQNTFAAQSNETDGFGHSVGEVEDYSGYSWYDAEETQDIWDYDELEVVDKGEYFALSLSDEDWESVNGIKIQVYLDDGEGYIDLGKDNMYEFDDDGDLKVDFDYTWVALDGQIVPFYFEYETPEGADKPYTYGYVPATLQDGTEIEIMVYWDEEHEEGYVPGYRISSDTLSVPQKGLMQLKNGDVVDFSCDVYSYDGTYAGVYSFASPMTVNGDIKVSYEEVGDFTTNISYELTDIYNNSITTEMIELTI